MRTTEISRFTPSLMTPRAIEESFVQREALAKRLLTLLVESTNGRSKHNLLLIGPRGIGKTHLVTLIYHRLKRIGISPHKLLIAWFREEEWGVTSFLDFVLRTLRALVTEYGDNNLQNSMNGLYQLDASVAERAGLRLLRDFVADRKLLIIVENLDDLFTGLEESGQKKLRAFLQDNQFAMILATSQRLFEGWTSYKAPFYGFFQVQYLKELEFEDAVRLLHKIALLGGDRELAAFLRTPKGRARVRAVHHLAGGNHRVYVIFSHFLNRQSLSNLVGPVLQTLDDLTPYYQARMFWVSPQQRKIVELLIDSRRSLSVKEIAQKTFLTHQTTSAQLKILRTLGYVTVRRFGRESFYELREPLMRLCIDVKRDRGEPIKLLVEFLRLWHSPTELENCLRLLEGDSQVERAYITQALRLASSDSEDPRVRACILDYEAHFNAKKYGRALSVAEELIAIRGSSNDWQRKGYALGSMGRPEDALKAFSTAIQLDVTDSASWVAKGTLLMDLKRYHETIESIEQALRLKPDDYFAWRVKGSALIMLGKYDEAISALRTATESDKDATDAKDMLANLFLRLDRHQEALELYDLAIQKSPQSVRAWIGRSSVLYTLGRNDEALQACETGLRIDPKDYLGWYYHGAILSIMNRDEQALISLRRSLEINPSYPLAWFAQIASLDDLGRHEEALAAVNEALRLGLDVACVSFDKAQELFALGRADEGLQALEDTIKRFGREEEHLAGHTKAVVDHLLVKKMTRDSLGATITKITELYEEHGLHGALAHGLVASIPAVISRSKDEITNWVELWIKAVGNRPEFELPLRLLKTAIRYVQTQDPRELLQLPVEERKLIESMLDENDPDETS